MKTLLEGVIETQMFVNLIQERLEVPSHHLLFFDKAVRRLKELNLSTLVSDSRHNPKYRQQNQAISGYKVDPSTPLYEHVFVLDSRDACFLLASDAVATGMSSSPGLKQNRDLFLGCVSNFEHALSRDDRSDSQDMTVGKGTDRQELVSQLDLNLDDFMKGPLIIPGPLLKERNIDRDGDAPTDQEYLYDTCWPTFNHNITHEIMQDSVRTELRNLREKRKQVAERLDSSCHLFIREECERTCFKFNHRLLNALRLPIHYDAKDSALLTSFPDECKAAVSLTAGIFNVSLVMLSARALCKVSSARDIVQALSIVSHLDSMNLLYQIDESAWRSMIIACNNIEEGYFRVNLFRLLMASLQSAGLSPNVLTSSQRCSSAVPPPRSECAMPSTATAGGENFEDVVLDTFVHLEELGLAWFAQKIVPFDIISSSSPTEVAASSPAPSTYYDSGPKSFQPSASTSYPVSSSSAPSTMQRFSNIFKKNSVEQHMVRKVRRKSVKASVASVETANFMRLVKDSSYFSMQRPQGPFMMFSVPQILPSGIIDESKTEMLLSSIKSEDIEVKVQEVRDIFNKIQKLKQVDASSQHKTDSQASTGCTSGNAVSGEVAVQALKVSSLCNCNTKDSQVDASTVYARMWVKGSPHASVKTSPGISASIDISSSLNADGNDDQVSLEKEVVTLKIDHIATDQVYVELYGDFKTDNAKYSHLFDQSLGVGHFCFGAISGNGKKILDLQLLSPTGEKTASLHLSTAFVPGSNRITSQTSMESFFDGKRSVGGASETRHVTARSASIGGDTSASPGSRRQPESVKKTWKERLSFGLYKGDKGGDGGCTPPPMKQIEEIVCENETAKLKDVQEAMIHLDLANRGCNGDTSSAVEDSTGSSMSSIKTVVDDAHIQGDVGKKREEIAEELEKGEVYVMRPTVVKQTDAPDLDRHADPLANLRNEIQSTQEKIMQKMYDFENISKAVIQEQKGAIGIYSCSPCLVCGYCMLDDEMMAEWAGFPSLFSGGETRSGEISNKKDIVKAHIISCVKCKSDIVPLLHIQQYEHIKLSDDEETSHVGLMWENTIPYLSPFGVRYVMESMMAENGTEMLRNEWLIKKSPLLYWNILWYSTRLNMPSGFIPRSWSNYTPAFSDIEGNVQISKGIDVNYFGPVVISWRECTVQAKIRHLLCGNNSDLSIADLFPGATKNELDVAEKIMTSLDSSLSSLSTAIIQCAELKSLQICFYESPARGLYLTMLMLVHYYKPPQMVNFQTNNIYMDLSKVVFANMSCCLIA